MIRKNFNFFCAFLQVSSEDGFGISSAFQHIATPPKNVAFLDLGQYAGKTYKNLGYSKTYYFSKLFQSTWVEAKTICKAFDLELATFETSEEAQNFLNKAAEIDYFANFDHHYAYVDGITQTPKSTTDWYWTNSGEKIPYDIKWTNGEPNNAGHQEVCLSIGRRSKSDELGFNDMNCFSYQTHFVCQKTVMTV